MKIKRFLILLTAVLAFSVTAYAEAGQGGYSYNITTETNEFGYNGKTAEYTVFTFKNMKYVPLRAVANFLGKEVSYNSSDGSINITDSKENVPYQSFTGTETAGIAAVVYNKISYNNTELKDVKNDFKAERENTANSNMPILNYNGSIYVPLKWLTEDFELLREYDGNRITITVPSEKLKYIPDSKIGYREYCEYFDNDGIISDELIKEALLRQQNHYSEPLNTKVEYQTLYYEGKPAIGIEVDVLNTESYLKTALYEVLTEAYDVDIK